MLYNLCGFQTEGSNSFLQFLNLFIYQTLWHYSFSKSQYFHLLIAPIEGFITLIG